MDDNMEPLTLPGNAYYKLENERRDMYMKMRVLLAILLVIVILCLWVVISLNL